jgi:hypothetical protein
MGAVKIGRNLIGGAGMDAGSVRTPDKIASITLGGSLLGGAADRAGSIFATPEIGAVKIGGDVAGGTKSFTGLIEARDKIGPVSIAGSLIGGLVAGTSGSGAIYSSSGTLGAVTIGRDAIGGAADTSAWIEADLDFASLTIGGSLMGGTAGFSGVALSVAGDVGPVKIGRNLIGGSIAGTASLSVSGYVESDESIASLTIGGSIFAGWDTSTGTLQRSASIRAGDDLGAVVIRGSMHGDSTSPIILSARGEAAPTATRDLAIKSVSIAGSVGHAFILGGADVNLNAVNGNAQLGAITVGRDWLAGSISAGVSAGGDGFGNANDALIVGASAAIVARIASIQIGGIVAGTAPAGDHFGFVAEHIGSFKSFGFTAPLNAAKDVIELSPTTADVTIREV